MNKFTNGLKDFLSVFVPRDGYFITPLLINLNVLIFILMISTGVHFFSPTSESLMQWGANFRPTTLEGEWWRLITCCFIHIGVFHLLMNMYALFYIGALLEPYLGKARFITAYLLTGIAASMASLWWHEFTVSAGASGAIFGMYGVFLAMLTTNLIERETRQALLSSIALFVGYNLLAGLKEGIDNAAHIGGLASGLLIGYAFLPSLKKPRLQLGIIALLTVLILSTCFVIYNSIPRDMSIYNAQMQVFATRENKALEVYSLPQNTPTDTLLDHLKNKGIDNWNKNIALIDELQKLNLTKDLHERNVKLKAYCELREKSYALIYKEIEGNTDRYQGEIEAYNKGIDSLLKELGGE
ncbi:MAG: peptidase [Chitinophagaceae bacterium]|nr:peptidase [Chitinophagaceae bacterium]